MKRLITLITLFAFAAAVQDECAWGESYWCQSLKTAKDCGAFNHCLSTIWKNEPLPNDGSEVCVYCENIIKETRDFLDNKQTVDEIKQFLDSACSIIPIKEMATNCQQRVDTYLPEILDMITAKLDPQVICTLLGLCKGGLKDQVQHRPINRLPVLKTIRLPEGNNGNICVDCKALMQDIKDIMTSATTEHQIEQLLEDSLCKALGSMSDECKALVEAYIPEIIELLTGEVSPGDLCAMIGFCNQTTNAALAKMKLKKSPLYKALEKTANDETCELCKVLVIEVQTMVRDNATEEEVMNYIKTEFCSKLGSLKDACDETVDNYGPMIFQLLSEEMDPATVCKTLGLCSQVTKPKSIPLLTLVAAKPVQSQAPVKASVQCIMCEFVMSKLDTMLGSNATEAEIQAALDKVCSMLPTSISQECTDFIDEYAPAIFQMLSQELDPKMVCTALGLCSSNTDLRLSPMMKNDEMCGACETAVQYLDSLLTQNATEQQIIDLLEKVCSLLPDTIKNQCDSIIQEYGPAIMELLAQFADPKEICTDIGLCSNTTKKVLEEKIVPQKAKLLGENECTYGPKFWCASMENAQRCKAVEHCQNHGWAN